MSNNEWQPVVGGRAMLGDDAVTVLYRSPVGDRAWVAPHTWEGSIVSCDATDLTEHPDDARHRRLLAAAREVGRAMDAMHAVGGSLSCCTSAEGIEEGLWRAIQELAAATAEADHA